MEEKETGESEPVDLRCGEQAELLSLIISGEEEATQEESDLGGNEKNQCDYSECFPAQCGSAWLSEPRPLSGSQLIRVRDNTMEQHGPSVCGSYKQRLNSTQAGRQADRDAQPPPSGQRRHRPSRTYEKTIIIWVIGINDPY